MVVSRMCAAVVAGGFAVCARADVVLELRPVDHAVMSGVITVDSGAEVTIEVYLSVTDDQVLLEDVRFLRFDFSATSAGLELAQFTWTLADAVPPGGGSYLVDPDPAMPPATPTLLPSIVYLGLSSMPGTILNLATEPARVATFVVRVSEAGTLDALNASADVADISTAADGGGLFASFDEPATTYSLTNDNLRGGSLEFAIRMDGEPGNNANTGDGEPGNGANANASDNANAAPPRRRAGGGACGLGIVQFLLIAACLAFPVRNRRT